jgi:hypothetical protein
VFKFGQLVCIDDVAQVTGDHGQSLKIGEPAMYINSAQRVPQRFALWAIGAG